MMVQQNPQPQKIQRAAWTDQQQIPRGILPQTQQQLSQRLQRAQNRPDLLWSLAETPLQKLAQKIPWRGPAHHGAMMMQWSGSTRRLADPRQRNRLRDRLRVPRPHWPALIGATDT